MGFTIKHEHHRPRREALNLYFSKGRVLRLENRIQQKVERLCARLVEYRASGQPVNLTAAYLSLTMDIITSYCFGSCSDMLDQDFTTKWKDTITTIMKNTAVFNHFSWMPKLLDLLPCCVAKWLPDISVLLNLKSARTPNF